MTTSQPRLPKAQRPLWAASAALALVAAACGGGSDAAPDSTPSTDVASSEQVATTSDDTATDDTEPDVTTPATTAAPETTTTTIALRGATPDDPAPVGDPEFDLIGFGSTDVVDGSMHGLAPIPLDPDGVGTGSCVAVFTTMTVQMTEALMTSHSALPRIELLDGESALPTDFADCDDTAVEAAGYETRGFVNAVAGTQLGIANVFHLEDGVVPTALLLGRAGDESSRYYDMTPLDGIPPLGDLTAGPAPADLMSTSPDASETVQFSGSILDSTSVFDVSVVGVTAVERSSNGDLPGRCITVVSTLIGVESPGAIINSYAIPDVFLLTRGQALEREIGECEDETLEGLGYFSEFSAGVAPGNTFAVQSTFVVPEGVEPDAIFVGEPNVVDGAFAFEPTAIADVPPAPVREKLNPDVDLVAVGATSAFELEGLSDTTWSGSIDGLVELTHDAASAICYAVIGEISRIGDGVYAPDVGIIADGGIFGSDVFTLAECDTAALEAAGYTDLGDLEEVATAEPSRFFATIFLSADVATLGSISVGNAASFDESIFVEPTVLESIPQP